MRESEQLLKEAAAILGVPVTDVPKVIRNLLGEINEMDTAIGQLTQRE